MFGPAASEAVASAEVVVGSGRQRAWVGGEAEQVDLVAPLAPVLSRIEAALAAGRRVCVLASGDPGFFGIVRLLADRLGPQALRVHPAPSSVALAFARIGVSWDDARVVSAHGRPLGEAVSAALDAPKVAVLTAPDNPPEAVGAALVAAGCGPRLVTVVSRLGEPGERVTGTDLAGLASGAFDPLSVVVLRVPPPGPVGPGPVVPGPAGPAGPALAWGQPTSAFAHRDGMITKAEVRAVSLSKLRLPPAGVLWDVGAGSASVAIEAAGLAPGLRVYAIEHQPGDAARAVANAQAHGVEVEVVVGRAPEVLAGLPDPHRVFVGGGGLAVLDACLDRLVPGGVVVANYTLVDRAVAAHARLGNLVEVSVARGVALAGGVRLAAENPVFVCWGPGSP